MRRRLLGWVLIVYGLAGLVLVVMGAVIGLELAARIERMAVEADGTIAAAARSTDAAAASFTSIDGSLSQAQASADGAAALSRDASGTLGQLAAAMQLSVLGAQPLLPLAADFETSADQARELGDTLDGVAGSLGDTRADVAAIGVELELLSAELDELRDSAGTGGGSPPLRLFVALLLTWLAIPAVGGVLGGIALLRPAPTTP